MADLDIAAPMAAALATRGYASLTPVQRAVLAPQAAARDLLVSAQTGSGKTVAFGLAIAPEILSGATLTGAARLTPADLPLALIIAPTRELALQVGREIAWLYGETGAAVATCVGGMDYRTERRALERGPHVVVGTPGRLRDHIERGGLDLSGLRAAVLDEADEMLDLGFREDLEFILQAAPEGRRTLMFSATVPKAIAELAKDFQKGALRIEAAGEARQHVDIAYHALSVTLRDREHAIFNLLRLHEAQTAIVFCKTRANVNHLLARMANRGFQVVALSGELSQQERTHALQALRDGRARVCIATDVAARGIDLPGLELVIHADLPTNSDTLLHRSGRTGRAGAKGVSALLVTPADFKKAQRLLQGARVVAEWGKAPSAEAVRQKDDARLLEHPTLAAAPGDAASLAAVLLDRFGADRVASAFIRLWREARSAPEELSDVLTAAPAAAAARPRGDFAQSVWFVIPVGHTGRAEARWLLPKVCEAGGITRDAIGAIRVRQQQTFVQIVTAAAAGFGEAAELQPGLIMRRLPDESVLDGPRATPGPAPAPKPAPDTEGKPAGKAGKPRWKARDRAAAKAAPRSAGFRSHGAPRGDDAAARPARAAGFRSHAAEGKAPPAPGSHRKTGTGKPGKPFPRPGRPKG